MRCPGWPCDSLYAVLPQHHKEWDRLEPVDLVERIIRERSERGAGHICFTGGEPFVQKPGELEALCEVLLASGFDMEFFTNGSIAFPEFIDWWSIPLVMDWKLTGSGEADNYLVERKRNAQNLRLIDSIKFVVKNHFDLEEALATWEWLRNFGHAQFWVGAAWEHITEEEVAQFVLDNKLPWRLNVQTHKYVFPGKDRGI